MFNTLGNAQTAVPFGVIKREVTVTGTVAFTPSAVTVNVPVPSELPVQVRVKGFD
jgi:hypothetical protein